MTTIRRLAMVGFFLTLLFGQFGSIALSPGINVYSHDVAVLVVLAVYSIGRKKWKRPALLLPILLFCGTAVLSLVVNSVRFPITELFQASAYLVRFIVYALLYGVLSQEKQTAQEWLKGLYIYGISFVLIGLVQFVLFPGLKVLTPLGWDEHYGRLFSSFLDPNFAGIVIVLAFFLGLYIFSLREYKTFRPALFLFQGGLIFAILLTYSRSTYLAFAAGIIAWSIVQKNWKIIAVLFLSAVVYVLLPNQSIDSNRLLRETSSYARVNNWYQSLSLFVESPVFGHGFNTLRSVARERRAIDTSGIVSRDAGGVNSSILFVLATTGIVGGVAYMYLLTKQLSVFQALKNKTAMMVGISSLVAVFIHSFFNHSLFYPWVMLWLWILLGTNEAEATIK